MKKLTSILAGLALFFTAAAFTGGEENVSTKIKTIFEKDFIAVSNVVWKKNNDLYVATFKWNDRNLCAAYSEDGELLVVGRYISLSQVPLSVSRNLEKEYKGYTFDQSVIEISQEGTSYSINAENEKNKLVIQADASGSLSVVKKRKK